MHQQIIRLEIRSRRKDSSFYWALLYERRDDLPCRRHIYKEGYRTVVPSMDICLVFYMEDELTTSLSALVIAVRANSLPRHRRQSTIMSSFIQSSTICLEIY